MHRHHCSFGITYNHQSSSQSCTPHTWEVQIFPFLRSGLLFQAVFIYAIYSVGTVLGPSKSTFTSIRINIFLSLCRIWIFNETHLQLTLASYQVNREWQIFLYFFSKFFNIFCFSRTWPPRRKVGDAGKANIWPTLELH